MKIGWENIYKRGRWKLHVAHPLHVEECFVVLEALGHARR